MLPSSLIPVTHESLDLDPNGEPHGFHMGIDFDTLDAFIARFLYLSYTNPSLKIDIFQFSNPNLLSAPSYFMIVSKTRYCSRRAKAEIRTKKIATTPKSDEKNCDYFGKADFQSIS